LDSRLSLSHIVAPGEVGGLESVVAALAGGMASRGHRVRILALLEPQARCGAFDAVIAEGVELTEIRLPARSYRAELGRLVTELSGFPGGIAHSHGYHADLVGLRAARRSGQPIVSTAHGFAGGDLKNRVYEWLDIRALRRFDGVVAVSRPLWQRLTRAGVLRDSLHLIANAYSPKHSGYSRLEARQRLGIPSDALAAGWVGRLSAEKGPDVFVEALAGAPKWTGSFIGGGPLQRALQASAHRLGIDARIRWHGVIPDAARLLAAFDALVLSSRTEGSPMVLLEGMAAGVPLVVTAVGGVPDIVTSEEAILRPPENPQELARALQHVHEAYGAAQQRVASARARLESAYSADRWLDRYESIYRKLVGTT
jgi:glycosyltransferase involved in cell wall biosynthesis